MALKLFEFVEKFMMDTSLLKLTQFEKTGSIAKSYISLGNLMINFHFQNKVDHIFRDPLQFCCSIVEFAFLLTIEMH